MFNSLRSRLWLTYLLIIVSVLVVITMSLLLFLVRNPRISREANSNLNLAANALDRQHITVGDSADLHQRVVEADELLDVRVIIYNANGQILADSRGDREPDFASISFRSGHPGRPEIETFTDEEQAEWLYTRRNLPGRYSLVLATARPNAPIRSILTDEFFLPIMQAGLLALLLSILLSFLMARWIAGPLQSISDAAGNVAKGDLSQIQPQGPREVQALAQAFNDMSERVSASRSSQRDFVANVSHELRTPLTSVQGFAQAILDGTVGSGKKLKQAAQVIVNEAGRMHRLVEDLLEVARFDSGTARLANARLDLTQLLEDVADRFSLSAEEKKVNLLVNVDQELEILGDEDRLTQVFTNLLENAFKHTPRSGKVEIEASLGAEGIEIMVADSGEGIPEKDLPRIFERFYQVDKSRTEGHGRGAGLGLSIARQIVEAHGGTIRAESSSGQGSRFHVHFPNI